MSTRGPSQQKLLKSCEQFVLNVYNAFEHNPAKLRAFVNLFHRTRRSNTKPLESQLKLVDIIKEYPELVEHLNKLVPEEFKIRKVNNHDHRVDDESTSAALGNIMKELQFRNPEKVQMLIQLIKDIKGNRSEKNREGFKESLTQILADEPNLLNAFLKQLRPYFDDNFQLREEELDNTNENSNSMQEALEDDYYRTRPGRIPRAQVGRRFKSNKRGRRGEIEIGQQIIVTKETTATSLPPTIRNELYLFEYLQNNLAKETYDELMRLIFLYTECVVSSTEVITMCKHIFQGNENYLAFFQEIIVTREMTRRKNTTYFKPLNEIDFKKLECARNGSYTKLPQRDPIMRSPPNPKNMIAFKILNKEWVSVPHGSEVQFQINSKNSYEENLFKCEDERYEFDNTIYTYDLTIKWLTNFETLHNEEKERDLVEKILRMKVLHKIYANNMEVLDIFRRTPVKIARALADKLKAKLEEIKEIKVTNAKKKWHETSQENFHRSLDHRSFYFKQYEKKLTYHKHFLSDALSRHKHLNGPEINHHPDKYWHVLNTFEGISNGVACHHEHINNNILKHEYTKDADFPRRVYPIYRMTFRNRDISQDIYDMLCLRLQTFHVNQNEREKINRYIKVFMFELLQFNYQTNSNKYDLVVPEKSLLGIASRIETMIYVESFNFNTTKVEDSQQFTSEETIFTTINNLKQQKEEDKMKEENPQEEKLAAPKPKIENESGEKSNKDSKMEEEPDVNKGKNDEDDLVVQF